MAPFLSFSHSCIMLTTEEKEKIADGVRHWTRTPPKTALLPSWTWIDIVQFHSGFACGSNIRNYLNFPKDLTVWYNSQKCTSTSIVKVMVPYFWTRGSKHTVYICYDDPQSSWALCDCVRRFFLLLFMLFFLLFIFFIFSDI